ncbi:MAG: hypothetical protein OXG23_05985, partial [Chloroflexi bacterium]|nr:hypothetical protein [Chloroflexota bacterium]
MLIPDIDRELIYLRREEANACMHHRLFHAATLTAGSGVELLLECLVGDLYRAYAESSDEDEQAQHLESDLKYFVPAHPENTEWGLGTWINFYKGCGIPDRLHTGLSYNPERFDFARLDWANRNYIKAKHEPYKVTVEDTSKLLRLFDELLDEVGILSAEERGKLAWRRTWGDRISFWSVHKRGSPETVLLQELFPLLELVERLIHEKGIGYEHKVQLMLVENYVFSTIDLVKDDMHQPLSLVDDAAVLALTLYWLHRQCTFDNAILRDCW